MKGFVLALLVAFSQATACKEMIRTVFLNGQNTVIFSDTINALSNDTISAAILGKRMILPLDETLYLVIVSSGGNYTDSLVLKQAIATVPNLQVFCKYCASAAGMVFATFTNHNRLVSDNSEMMMHEMYVEHVTANMLLNKVIDPLIVASDEFNSLIRNVMGMTKKSYDDKIRGKEWSVKGRDLVKLKLADEFVNIECSRYVANLAPNTCKTR